ncbi:MAG: hypothetical protein ACLFVQ_09535 [Chitinispirillaceae bacterium]
MSKLSNFLCGLLMAGLPLAIQAQSGNVNARNLLMKSTSSQKLVETARDHQWAIDFSKQEKDTLLVIAIRVQFKEDTSALTTGNGLFGIRGDTKEQKFINQDTVYKYDTAPHDSLYFADQLRAVRKYYEKVSRGNLTLDFDIYPRGSGETGYSVDEMMTNYSPGWKKKKESSDQYWTRKTYGLMRFIKEALEAAAKKTADSPFKNIYRDADGVLRERGTNRKAVFLIFHAGASYITDGGENGAAYADSPSDMIDAFVNEEMLKYYKDTLGLEDMGITVSGYDGEPILIEEVMLCAETSNQDGLNWGIQGILVNQVARQLGIPDLFSTSSGISAIGAFCIMDFAGYSAGRGFIPPYPSAWVRAFMGWDKAYPASMGSRNFHNVTSLSSALDRYSEQNTDTTILLVPINNHEYYLIENRQRNLSGDKDRFNYEDSSDYISAYPFNVNLEENVDTVSDKSRVIINAKNNDISLPASGVLVWHIDERVIQQRLAHNFVNADSTYRGIRLVEADGVNDLGVMFSDMFYQAAFDYGGAEDVFPHKTDKDDKNNTVTGFGPYSRPSTRSNDGGHTYLNLKIEPTSENPVLEHTKRTGFDYKISNYSDSVFRVGIEYDYLVPSWPRMAAPEGFHDPLTADLDQSSPGKELILLSESGRLYVYPTSGDQQSSYGNRLADVYLEDSRGDTIPDSVSQVSYLDSIGGTFTFPTVIENKLYVPSKNGSVVVFNSVDAQGAEFVTVSLPAAPSSYLTGTEGESWVLGLENGRVFVGSGEDSTGIIKLSSDSAVCAVAVIRENPGTVAAVQTDGTLSICSTDSESPLRTVRVPNGIGPYTIVTGDLNRSGKSEIVVADSRHGVWVYDSELALSEGWQEEPNDWANAYHIDPEEKKDVRSRYPKNFSAPALADLNRDGYLDIVVSGTNGIYALNYKGALLSKWPAYLDNRYWYQRGSITTSPVVVSGKEKEPLVLFSSPTGEKATFTVTKIESADREKGVITFRRQDGTLDSLWDLSSGSIDTVLDLSDSLIYPYILPGGFIDALGADAKRPLSDPSALGSSEAEPQSCWPLSAGAPVTTSPLISRTDNSSSPDLFAVSSRGAVYRWKLPTEIMPDSLFWPQNGFDAARSFAYGADLPEIIETNEEPLTFWNYPNPTAGARETTFKFKFSGPAKKVRLDIFTITGYRMDTFSSLSGSYPDWNEFRVNLRKYGPGVYRCRMEARIAGKKHVEFWKMAVVK